MTDEKHHDTDDTAAEKPARMDLSKLRDMPLPERKIPREIKVDLPPYDQRKGVSAHDRLAEEKARRPGPVAKLARTLVGFAIFAVLLLGVYGILSAIDDDAKPQAAWSEQSAPVVKPVSLSDY
ncbi:MAG: hypothetical protein JWP18_491 [Solirubrobacterales bacterium]|jgi:hypothetical protein|nr:hypothetical protein [Solirubrobacterales bacterium]